MEQARVSVGRWARSGFTLIELLVVVSIIALLISILLPSLKSARDQAKSVVCAANTRQVGQSVAGYLAENKAVFPPSYVYPTDESGSWGMRDGEQSSSSVPNGYLHWSHALYSGGKAGEKAFQCPSFRGGGAPRTNPGRDSEDWEAGQHDANGNTNPNELVDKQAPRMAYTANAAIMPRNKFTPLLSGGQRTNKLVLENRVRRAAGTILTTEFLTNWKALGEDSGSGVLIKSHRPINPFYHATNSRFDEYGAPESSPGFIYGLGKTDTPTTEEDYGILPYSQVRNIRNVLKNAPSVSQLNAIGRHHPGGNGKYGGTANFLFVDGHAERMTILQTMIGRMWGDRYYSLSGENQILN